MSSRAPELKKDMPNEDYHSGPGYSASVLKAFLRSRMHGIAAVDRPYTPPSAAQVMGTLAHTALLEHERFSNEYAGYDGRMDTRTKAYKEFAEENPGKQIVKAADLNQAVDMASEALEECATLLVVQNAKDKVVEGSIFFEHLGLWCKTRPDLMCSSQRIIVEYKTATDASPDAFRNSAWRYQYQIQCALQIAGFREYYGVDPDYLYLVQESVYPYACAMYEPSQSFIREGEIQLHRAIENCLTTTEDCRHTGYGTSPITLEPPVWFIKEDY